MELHTKFFVSLKQRKVLKSIASSSSLSGIIDGAFRAVCVKRLNDCVPFVTHSSWQADAGFILYQGIEGNFLFITFCKRETLKSVLVSETLLLFFAFAYVC